MSTKSNDTKRTLGQLLAQNGASYKEAYPQKSFFHSHQAQALELQDCEHLTDEEALRVAVDVLNKVSSGKLSAKIIETIDGYDNRKYRQAILDAGDKLSGQFHKRFAKAVELGVLNQVEKTHQHDNSSSVDMS